MTDRMAALSALSLYDVPERSAALEDFYGRYRDDPLIVDKWFGVQATSRSRQRLTASRRLQRIRHSRSPIPIACAR